MNPLGSSPVADRAFKRPLMIIAGAILIGMLLLYLFWKPDGTYTLLSRTLVCESPLEAAVTADGASVVNDGGNSVTCISTDGDLRYHITMKPFQQITGITLDDHDNLYAYVSEVTNNGDTPTRDDICEYDATGRYVRTLATIDYTSAQQDGVWYTRTSPLRYEAGYLYLTGYTVDASDLIRVDVATGEMSVLGSIPSTTPFLYTDIEGHPDGVYYYAKADGEVGRGQLGAGETVLFTGDYSTRDDAGIRPFYVRYVDGSLYLFDYWGTQLYMVADGAVVSPGFDSAGFAYAQGTEDISDCAGNLCGITDGVPWYVRDGVVTELPVDATVPFGMALIGSLANLVQTLALPLVILAALFLVIAFLYHVLVRGERVFWKFFLGAAMLMLFFVFIMYMVVSNEQRTYTTRMSQYQESTVSIVASSLDGDGLAQLTGSSFFGTQTYATMSTQLDVDFSIYHGTSDIAAVVLVPAGDGGGMYEVVSNRGFGGLLSENSGFDDVVSKLGEGRVVTAQEGDRIISCAPIYTSQGSTAGYLCVYTTLENLRDKLFSLWSIPYFAGALIISVLIMYLYSRMLSRRMQRFANTITDISGGDFDVRLERLPNDEIGDVGRCVNSLAGNVQALIDENTAMSRQIQASQEEVLISLASITEAKSGQTAQHVRRVSGYVEILAREFGYTAEKLEYIRVASMLHDIGKLMIPNEILEKPGRLTDEEFEVMKLHTVYGEELLHNAPGDIMGYARIIALQHHEHWGGGGYPKGLAGTDIDLSARITALADVYDALTSVRSYKDAFPVEKARQIIVDESGGQFDPDVVEVFLRLQDGFRTVAEKNPD